MGLCREGVAQLYATSYVLYDLLGISILLLVAIPVSWLTGAPTPSPCPVPTS